MKFTERNIFCGETQPQAVVETAYSKTTNKGIYSKTVTDGDGTQRTLWYITSSTYEIYLDKIKEIVDEHDELIAELIEGRDTA